MTRYLLVVMLTLGACTAAPSAYDVVVASSAMTAPPSTAEPATMTSTTPVTSTPSVVTATTTVDRYARPGWLGTRPLPLRPDEFGEVVPTPPELRQRAFETLDLLEPPPDETFRSTIAPIPPDVLARSTWSEDCPVTLDELSYITVSHWGFDQRFHTGEMIVNAEYADPVVGVFEQLHAARFPIEQMRVVTQADVDAHPTGDWNETTSFVCRPAVGSGSWSRHAYGLAIDINPFHNPYLKGDLVLPELATYYTDRTRVEPGMIVDGSVAIGAFAEMGWPWGGNWNSLKDWMHFSDNGR
jgi:hypothetical protein